MVKIAFIIILLKLIRSFNIFIVSNTVVMADEEEELVDEELMCAPGKHKWKQDQCMVCTNCGECTGYGGSCVNSGLDPRNPGMYVMTGLVIEFSNEKLLKPDF